MVDPETSEVTSAGESHISKQAACHLCRRSKVRCVRPADAVACKKCASAGVECVVPEYHVGRYKGVKNKRSGLDKAIYQVEEAVKKARTKGSSMHDEHARALRQLLSESESARRSSASPARNGSQDVAPSRTSSIAVVEHVAAKQQESSTLTSFDPNSPKNISNDDGEHDEVTVNNANNPLQLLAMVSSIPDSEDVISDAESNNDTSPSAVTVAVDEDDTRGFFSPMTSKLDIGKDLDPLELGLVSETDVETLFEFFHDRLAHTRWGLDRTIHSSHFVRSRSAFLFTSIMSCAALFLPNTASLSTRLNNHCKLLARQITSIGYRSLEIVLAYMLNIPWLQPGKNWAADDETCHYISTAMTIAIDLCLNKIVIPSSTMRPQSSTDKIAQADCIEAQRALNMDCHMDIESSSALGRRLLRARERTWLALFNLDRGVCLARGRPWVVPCGPLVETCDTWHISDISDPWDGSLVAAAVLRRDFSSLVASVRATCDEHQFDNGNSANIVKLMREKIEGFFTQWYSTWTYQIQQDDGTLPPYNEILVSHGKLSAYCNVINHPTASMDVKQFFRAAGLTAAINVIRTAAQNESRLHSMPNNSVIMVSFAACFVLGLSTTKKQGRMYIAENVRASINDVASALERIGSVPSHRKGASTLFGRHIKRIMRQHTTTFETSTAGGQNHATKAESAPLNPANAQGTTPHTLHVREEGVGNIFHGFDSMTDDQLLEMIQNPQNDIDTFNMGLQNEDHIFMDWLDWPSLT